MSEAPKKSIRRGNIEAYHISAAREMHDLSVAGRTPQNHKSSAPRADDKVKTVPKSTNITVPAKALQHLPCKNPQCQCCGCVIIPSPAATFPIKDSPSITINDNWHIFTQRKPILNASEIETFESILDIPVPEMIFGNNKVELKYEVGDDVIFHIMFNPLDALKLVEKGSENLIKVSYANDWFKSRYVKHSNSENVTMEVYKPFDWTYSSLYRGTILKGEELFTTDDTKVIPIDKLTGENPILFYDDMILYEDELGDNGISILNVKIRAMKNCLLMLQRLFIRVDDVLLRIYDTRLYVDFDTNEIVREFKVQEDTYNSLVLKTKGSIDPKKPLRDINWCSQHLPVKSVTREYTKLNQDQS